VLHARLVAPLEQVLDLRGADPVTVVRVDVAHLARPPAVAVTHDPDVAGHGLTGEQRAEPMLVHPVDELTRVHPP
jgi:hypothetical protein